MCGKLWETCRYNGALIMNTLKLDIVQYRGMKKKDSKVHQSVDVPRKNFQKKSKKGEFTFLTTLN